MRQYEPGFDKFLFHQLQGNLVQLPSFQSKRSKRPETQVEISETLPSNSIRDNDYLKVRKIWGIRNFRDYALDELWRKAPQHIVSERFTRYSVLKTN